MRARGRHRSGDADIAQFDNNPALLREGLPAAEPVPPRAELSAALDRPLRIALLGYRSRPYGGGQGIYLKYLSRALVDAGHRVDVISGPPYPHLDPRVPLIELPSLDLFANGLGSLRPRHLTSCSDMMEWTGKLTGGFAEPYTFGRRALKYLRRHRGRYDLVHDNQSLSYGMLALQRLGIPLVSTIHHPITHDLRLALAAARSPAERLLIRRWHSFLRMQKRVARRLEHIVTVSECSRRDIGADFGIDPAQVGLVYNGVDTAVFRPLPAVRRRPRRLMATASADAPLKGLRYLLLAYAELVRDDPALELLVIGRPQPGGKTERLLASLGLTGRVRFESGISTDTLVQRYAEATIAVVPSLYEGFGLPAGEAMACGVPVVATDGGALPEIVADAGVTVPRGDAGALAAALRSLLADPARREALGVAGRRRIVDNFSWSVCASAMVAYYRRVLARADR